MSTGYGWEDIRQVCATLLGARNHGVKFQRYRGMLGGDMPWQVKQESLANANVKRATAVHV